MSTVLGAYTPAVRAGDLVFVSGQLGMREGAVAEGGVAVETLLAIENLAGLLAEQGLSLSNVVKTTCYLTDIGAYTEFNNAYIVGFGDHRPARATVEVSDLAAGCRIEIEAIAYGPQS